MPLTRDEIIDNYPDNFIDGEEFDYLIEHAIKLVNVWEQYGNTFNGVKVFNDGGLMDVITLIELQLGDKYVYLSCTIMYETYYSIRINDEYMELNDNFDYSKIVNLLHFFYWFYP